MASYYSGPGTYGYSTDTSSVTYRLYGKTIIGTFQIGDHAFADVEYKCRCLETDSYNEATEEWSYSNFGAIRGRGILTRVYGYGDTYDANDIQPATLTLTVRDNITTLTQAWNPTDFTMDVDIPDDITSIGKRLFESIAVNAVEFIETYGILNDDGIWALIREMYDGQGSFLGTAVQSSGFCDNQGIIKNIAVHLGSGVKSIGDYAFRNNYSPSVQKSRISEFTVDGNIESIGLLAFENQSEITGIDFHESPTSVGIGAFNNCNKIEYINISDEWHNTGTSSTTNTFNNCYKLERISPKNVIKNLQGINYNNCNCLSQITIRDEDFEYRPASNSLRVDLYAGSVLDEDGYFITEVNENSVINPNVLAYDWKRYWNRVIAYYTDVSLFLYHKGKRIEIRMYSRGDIIALTHKDIIYYLKTVELIDRNVRHNQTPVFVTHQGKWLQICY